MTTDPYRPALPNYPSLSVDSLFVYRECVCGEWCLTGVCARAPICGCGRRFWPATDPRVPGLAYRDEHCLAVVGNLEPELPAMRGNELNTGRRERHYDPAILAAQDDYLNEDPRDTQPKGAT